MGENLARSVEHPDLVALTLGKPNISIRGSPRSRQGRCRCRDQVFVGSCRRWSAICRSLITRNFCEPIFPSGAATTPSGSLPLVGMGYSVIVPAGVILPISLPLYSVNQPVPVRPRSNPEGSTAAGRNNVFGNRPAGRNLSDLVCGEFGEPEIPVRSRSDPWGPLALVGMAYSTMIPPLVILPSCFLRFR